MTPSVRGISVSAVSTQNTRVRSLWRRRFRTHVLPCENNLFRNYQYNTREPQSTLQLAPANANVREAFSIRQGPQQYWCTALPCYPIDRPYFRTAVTVSYSSVGNAITPIHTVHQSEPGFLLIISYIYILDIFSQALYKFLLVFVAVAAGTPSRDHCRVSSGTFLGRP